MTRYSFQKYYHDTVPLSSKSEKYVDINFSSYPPPLHDTCMSQNDMTDTHQQIWK